MPNTWNIVITIINKAQCFVIWRKCCRPMSHVMTVNKAVFCSLMDIVAVQWVTWWLKHFAYKHFLSERFEWWKPESMQLLTMASVYPLLFQVSLNVPETAHRVYTPPQTRLSMWTQLYAEYALNVMLSLRWIYVTCHLCSSDPRCVTVRWFIIKPHWSG